jgi:nitric oxide synthase oxygenase domain/subunit
MFSFNYKLDEFPLKMPIAKSGGISVDLNYALVYGEAEIEWRESGGKPIIESIMIYIDDAVDYLRRERITAGSDPYDQIVAHIQRAWNDGDIDPYNGDTPKGMRAAISGDAECDRRAAA